MNIKSKKTEKGFSLIEVLVVVGIIIVLTLVVLYTLNPHQLINQGQDGNRVAGIGTLDKAISLYYSDAVTNPSTLYLGSSSVLYLSIPDPTATTTAGTNCAGIGISSTSTTYHCAASSTFQKTNGTGWIPINFSAYSGGNPIATLPIDPINTTSSGEYYVYVTNGTTYEVMANPSATKNASNTSDFDKGSNLTLQPTFPTVGGGTSGGTSQNIWVVDSGNNRVEEFSATGTYESKFGSAGTGNGQFKTLNSKSAFGIAVDGSENIWVADYGNNRVQEFSATGTYESQFGSAGTGNGQFEGPVSLAIDGSGNIWVTDGGNDRVEEFSGSGAYESQFGSAGTGNGQIGSPEGITIDGSGNIWVTDNNFPTNQRVEEFSGSGAYESQFGSSGNSNGQFSGPISLAADGSGNIWVTDYTNYRAQEFSAGGTYESQLGCATGACSGGSGNGKLTNPQGIAFDSNGNIWIVDAGNNRVQEFSATGTYESQFGSSGSSNGKLSSPWGILIH